MGGTIFFENEGRDISVIGEIFTVGTAKRSPPVLGVKGLWLFVSTVNFHNDGYRLLLVCAVC